MPAPRRQINPFDGGKGGFFDLPLLFSMSSIFLSITSPWLIVAQNAGYSSVPPLCRAESLPETVRTTTAASGE
jgi:hypothetical protein